MDVSLQSEALVAAVVPSSGLPYSLGRSLLMTALGPARPASVRQRRTDARRRQEVPLRGAVGLTHRGGCGPVSWVVLTLIVVGYPA